MRIAASTIAFLLGAYGATAFVPSLSSRPSFALKMGYLDDLNLGAPEEDTEPEVSREDLNMAQDQKDRFGPGQWDQFVEFNEFDGGDGQMGVAGDGNSKLEQFDNTQMASSLAKSQSMSAKNAWGTSTGYADELIDKGMDTQRAQQLENWQNQQEVLQARKQQRFMTDSFDHVEETSQWDLSKFGATRNEDFDLNDEFGAVQAGQIDGTIELAGRMNFNSVHEFSLTNEYMGFADFRAAFVDGTSNAWKIEPSEGSLSKQPTNFMLKFRPDSPGMHEGFLVIETEDFKKTYKLIGSTA